MFVMILVSVASLKLLLQNFNPYRIRIIFSESLLPHCLKVVYALTILKDLTKISVLRSLNCTLHTTYFVIFRLEDISLELLISFKTSKTSSSQHEFYIKLENIGKCS